MIRATIILGLVLVSGVAAADAITLSPAVVPLGGHAGESTTQHLTLFNRTAQALTFRLVAKDVVVREGQRVYIEAGLQPNSIAATVVFSAATVQVPPGEDRSVDVRLTLPPKMTSRAVVILFQGMTRIGGNATASLGALLTFDLSGRESMAPGELRITPPTPTTNAMFSLPIFNDGTEPTIARGVAAIVTSTGALLGKVTLDRHRYLPGERFSLAAQYPGELPHGTYRVVATIEGAQRSWTRTTELVVP